MLKKSNLKKLKLTLISCGLLFVVACGGSDANVPPMAPPMTTTMELEPAMELALFSQVESRQAFFMGGYTGGFYEAENTNFSLVESTQQQMIIRRANMVLETESFDLVNRQIAEIVTSFDGFIQNSRRDLTTGFYTLRVPVEHFAAVNTHLQSLGYVTSFSESSEDVSAQFTDLNRRLNIRQQEEHRLETMLENTTDLNEILNLERRLSNLRLTIHQYENRLTEIDQLASFSTINITLIYVAENILAGYPNDNFFNNLTDAFASSIQATQNLLEGLAMFLALTILPVFVFGGIGVVIWLLVRHRQNKEQNKEA